MQVFNILGVASFDYFFSICVWFFIYFMPMALVLSLFTQKFFKWFFAEYDTNLIDIFFKFLKKISGCAFDLFIM